MSLRDVVTSHVEVLMESMLGEQVRPVHGEVRVVHRTAEYRVRIDEIVEHPHVEIYAIVLADVDADPGLFEALNTINTKLAHGRAFLSERRVVFATVLLGETLDEVGLACACEEIAHAAHIEGPRLAAVFGGQVAHPDAMEG